MFRFPSYLASCVLWAVLAMAAFSTTAPTFAESGSAGPPNEPILHLTFSESAGPQASETSGMGHLTSFEKSARRVAGIQGQAVELGGDGGHVVTQPSEDLRIGGDLTVSLWIYPHAYPTEWIGLVSKMESDLAGEFAIRLKDAASGELTYGTGSTACSLGWDPSVHLPLDTWTQLTAVRDLEAATFSLYVNGYEEVSRTACGAAAVTWNPLWIGKSAGTEETFDGVIDEVKVYDRALTAAEVAEIHTRDLGFNNNLISNPGFESGAFDPPFTTAARGTLEIDDTLSASGQYSLKHTASANNSYTSPYIGQAAMVSRAAAGQRFQLSAMATAAEAIPVQLRILCMDASFGFLDSGVGTFTTSSSWQRFAISHICPSGTQSVSVRLDNDGGAGKIVWWDDLYMISAVNDADFVAQNVPASLGTGETASVTVTMTNTGTTLWTRGQNYRLGPQPAGSNTWGPNRVQLAQDDVVLPGASHDFVFDITAPSTAGSYDFQWRMVEELVEWFGDSTLNLSLEVVAPDTTPPTQDSLAVPISLWEIDGINTYRISASASDTESGVQRIDAAINLQGDQSAQRRGWFTWDADGYLHGGDQIACKGGGFASKDLTSGDAGTITLVSCSSGERLGQRSASFVVRPELAFGELADNDVSMSVEDTAGNISTWTNYDVNFQTVITSTPGGTTGCGMAPLTSSGGPFFKGANAAPVYLRGSHTWDNAQDWGGSTIFDNNAYLAMMEAKGHNFIRLWSWQREKSQANQSTVTPMPWVKEGGCYDLYEGTLDLNNPSAFDETKVRFNEAYFDRLAQRVGAACGKNIYVDVMLFQGYSVRGQNSPWPWHPFNIANNCDGVDGNLEVGGTTNGLRFHEVDLNNPSSAMEEIVGKLQKAYVKKTIDTLNTYPNVLYEVANEDVGSPANIAWEYAIIDYVQQQDPSRKMGMTSFGFNNANSVLVNSGASWISPAVNDGQDYAYAPPVSDGSPVILSDNDHLRCILETPSFVNDCVNGGPQINWLRRANYRQWIWKSFTRGVNVLLMDAVQHTIPGQPSNYPAVDPGNPAFPFARDYVGHTGYFADQLDLNFVTPRTSAQECSSTGYCLADLGVKYLVYQPENSSFSVNLPAGVYEAKWFNPHGVQAATSKTTPVNAASIQAHTHDIVGNVTVSTAGNVQFGNGTSFPRPFGCEGSGKRYECDAVLQLTLLPTDPPPAAPTNVSATDGTFTDRVRITWNAVSGATSYEVWRHDEADTVGASRLVAGFGTTTYDDNAAPSGVHYYWVRARNQAGISGFSASDSGFVNYISDIAVTSLWNGTERADGATVALPSIVEGYPQTYTLRIENRGLNPLVINNPATLLANHPCIDQIAAVDPSLEFGETTDLEIYADCSEGSYAVALAIDSNDPDENPFNLTLTLQVDGGPSCTQDATHLCLQNDRFRVSGTFVNPNTGVGGQAQAVPYAGSDESGMFWFFGPGNLEIVVKVLDGRTINNAFWVFHGGATHVQYTLFVEDLLTGDDWQTTKPEGSLCGGAHTDAFPQGSQSQGSGSAKLDDDWKIAWPAFDVEALAGSVLGDQPDKAGNCVPSDTVLCLQNNRFAVEVDWQIPAGTTGDGHAIPVTSETGLFWFFGPGNLELMLKVLDARTFNNHFWVFYGSLSDVNYDILVTDTTNGNTATYHNPQGTYCGGADVEALPGS